MASSNAYVAKITGPRRRLTVFRASAAFASIPNIGAATSKTLHHIHRRGASGAVSSVGREMVTRSDLEDSGLRQPGYVRSLEFGMA